MKKSEKITANITANMEITKKIASLSYYSEEQFIKDAETYIKAIKERRMLCIIHSVSNSGMSRVLQYSSCKKKKKFYFIFKCNEKKMDKWSF